MDNEILEKYKQAGKIAAQALEFGCKSVKEGMLLFDLAELIENKIHELGGEIAFPVNLSLNEVAAHYTPTLNDKTIVNAEDYLKIDVGVHVDGYIGDTAKTIRLAGKDDLIICSEKMLENALRIVKPGIKVGEIGEVIENTAKEFGFNPIINLTGHGLDRFNLHAGVTIPNIKIESKKTLEENEVYAIEPFCTKGSGKVKDSDIALIFKWMADRPTRMAESRKILDLGKNKYNKLPFAKRWIQKEISSTKSDLALMQLCKRNSIYPYKILKEASNGNVSQAEHTIFVKDKPIVLTK